jgi:uncharacterized protein (DUF1697 family)
MINNTTNMFTTFALLTFKSIMNNMTQNKKTFHYLALLRGINVGGNNIIKMADLKAFFEELGYKNVTTYIQSGNIVFESTEDNISELSKKLEYELSEKYNYKSTVLVVNYKTLKNVIENAPENFGVTKEEYKYDIIFIKEPYKSLDIIENIPLRDGVDSAIAGDSIIYISRTIKNIGQSYLKKIASKPIYKYLTIRNWNTSSKLYSIMAARLQ